MNGGTDSSTAGSSSTARPEQEGPLSSTLLEVSPAEVEIKIPSFFKGPLLTCCAFAAVLAASVLSFTTYSAWSNRLNTTKWRITTSGDSASSWEKWEICALLPYSDDHCNEAIDISESEVLAFPPLPNGWKEHTLEVATTGTLESCATSWKAKGAADIDNPPYIKWTFPTAKVVGCFKVQYTDATTGWWSEIVPTIIQAEQDGNWVSERITEFKNLEEWDNISTVPEIFEPHPQDSPSKLLVMAAGLVFAILSFLLFVISLLTIGDYSTQRKGRLVLQQEVRLGAAFVATSTPEQWAGFVQGMWGWGGNVHRAQHSWRRAWIILFVVIVVMMAAVFKLNSDGKKPTLSWPWCFLLGTGTSLLIVCSTWSCIKWTRGHRFRLLRRGRIPAVIGPSSMYFADLFVAGDKILSSHIVTTQAAKTLFIVIWTNVVSHQKLRLTVPVEERQVDQLKAFLLAHFETYHWAPAAPTPSDVETGVVETADNAVGEPTTSSEMVAAAAGVLQDDEPASSSTSR